MGTKAGTVNTEGMDPDFRNRLNALVAASGGRLTIYSGYRDPAHQAKLYAAKLKQVGGNAKLAGKWVAPPGTSYHGPRDGKGGRAADLRGDLKWAHANAARFGLYFPLSNEEWHVELMGTRGKGQASQQAPAAGQTHTDHGHKHGSPEDMDALMGDAVSEANGTIEGQLANLLAIISSPTDRTF